MTVTSGATEAAPAGAEESNDVQIEEVWSISQTDGLEETHQNTAVEPPESERSDLDEVIGNLLHRDTNNDPESQVIGEIIMETGKC